MLAILSIDLDLGIIIIVVLCQISMERWASPGVWRAGIARTIDEAVGFQMKFDELVGPDWSAERVLADNEFFLSKPVNIHPWINQDKSGLYE